LVSAWEILDLLNALSQKVCAREARELKQI